MSRSGDPKYALRQLTLAVEGLATSARPLRDRLVNAAVSHLHRLQEVDFSGDSKAEYRKLSDLLTAVEPTGKLGSFEATIRTFDDEEAEAAATAIFELYQSMLRAIHQHS